MVDCKICNQSQHKATEPPKGCSFADQCVVECDTVILVRTNAKQEIQFCVAIKKPALVTPKLSPYFSKLVI